MLLVDLLLVNTIDLDVLNNFQSLREKEKGDWKKLTLEEKKALYRTSFCKTFAEIKAPTGEWKMSIGAAMIAISMGIMFTAWMNAYGEFLFW